MDIVVHSYCHVCNAVLCPLLPPTAVAAAEQCVNDWIMLLATMVSWQPRANLYMAALLLHLTTWKERVHPSDLIIRG